MQKRKTTFQIEDESVYCAGDEHFLRRGRMRFVLVTNILVLEKNALKMRVQTSAPLPPPPPHTHTATFKQNLY